MNHWDAEWMDTMDENNVERALEDRYMDDIREFMRAWHEDVLYWCKEWEEEDLASEETMADRSSRIILDSMVAPMGFLIFTKESPSDFEDGKLPTLDIKIWIDNLQIWYMFYQKPMGNNIV